MNRKQTYKRDCGACAVAFSARSGSQRFCDGCKAQLKTKSKDLISLLESNLQACEEPERLRKLEELLGKEKNSDPNSGPIARQIKEVVDGMKKLPDSRRAMGASCKTLWRCGNCGALCTSRKCLECELRIIQNFKNSRGQENVGN